MGGAARPRRDRSDEQLEDVGPPPTCSGRLATRSWWLSVWRRLAPRSPSSSRIGSRQPRPCRRRRVRLLLRVSLERGHACVVVLRVRAGPARHPTAPEREKPAYGTTIWTMASNTGLA